MITWYQHSTFSKELKTLSKSIHSIENDIRKVQKLLVAHFYVDQTKGSVISPGKIHRITVENDVTGRELWKIEVVTPEFKTESVAEIMVHDRRRDCYVSSHRFT